MKISDIEIGNRYRKHFGDIDALCKSINDVGLLHPVVVTEDGKLIAGERRVEAAKRLGWSEIPVTVATDLEGIIPLLKAERDENTCREPFRPSEAIALGRKIEKLERPAARERQVQPLKRGTLKPRCGNLPQREPAPKTRQVVAEAVGMKETSYRKAAAVVAAAEREPEKFAPVVERMDATGNVDRAYREIKQAEEPPVPANDPGKDEEKDELLSRLRNCSVATLRRFCQQAGV